MIVVRCLVIESNMPILVVTTNLLTSVSGKHNIRIGISALAVWYIKLYFFNCTSSGTARRPFSHDSDFESTPSPTITLIASHAVEEAFSYMPRCGYSCIQCRRA